MVGPELAADLALENMNLGIESVPSAVDRMTPDGEFVHVTAGESQWMARTVVIASGARLRALGVPGEQEFEGRGVSHCASCDGPLYRGRRVVVVGGGDAALQEAIALAQHGERVFIAMRGNRFRARASFVQSILSNPRIEVLENTTVLEILGSTGVDAVRLADGASGNERTLECSGVFAYVGLEPNTGFVPSSVPRDGSGRLETDEERATACTRVWAIGAVRAGHGGSLVDSINDAKVAVQCLVSRFA